MTDTPTITSQLVPENQRMNITAKLFGMDFPLHLEPFVFNTAENMADDYTGGYWDFYTLNNEGFYMAPNSDKCYHLSCPNGYVCELSADAFGIVCCLYAYSLMSFGGNNDFAITCAEHYHLLREYMFGHPEVASILRAID